MKQSYRNRVATVPLWTCVFLVSGALSDPWSQRTRATCSECRCDLKFVDGKDVTTAELNALTEPVLITGLMDNWPAFTKWGQSDFESKYGDLHVGSLFSEFAFMEDRLFVRNVTDAVRGRHSTFLFFSDYPMGFVHHLKGDFRVPGARPVDSERVASSRCVILCRVCRCASPIFAANDLHDGLDPRLCCARLVSCGGMVGACAWSQALVLTGSWDGLAG